MNNKKIVFATLTRNPSYHFHKSLMQMSKIGEQFNDYKIIVIESDSYNISEKFFNQYKTKKNFIIKSLGNLKEKLDYGYLRTERIAFSRNEYLRIINNHQDLKNFDYLVVFDSDGVSNLMNYSKLKKAINIKKNWVGQFANQLLFYYDIYALRAKDWVEYDCLVEKNKTLSLTKNPRYSFKNSISKKMIRIKKNTNLINVESAFGGFAIYKINCINDAKYIGQINGNSICEHISFNQDLISKNGNLLFINPKLINSFGINEHTIKSKFLTLLPETVFNFIYKNYSRFYKN